MSFFLCAIVSRKTRGDRRGGRAQRGPEALGVRRSRSPPIFRKGYQLCWYPFLRSRPPLGHRCLPLRVGPLRGAPLRGLPLRVVLLRVVLLRGLLLRGLPVLKSWITINADFVRPVVADK